MSEYILITGGCGYIGKAVLNKLENKYKIIIIDNLETGTKLGVKKNLFFLKRI